MATYTPDPTSPDYALLTDDSGATSTVPTSQAIDQGAALVPAQPPGQPEDYGPPAAPSAGALPTPAAMPVPGPQAGDQGYPAPFDPTQVPNQQPVSPVGMVNTNPAGPGMGQVAPPAPALHQPATVSMGQPGTATVAPPPGPNPAGALIAPGQPGQLGLSKVEDQGPTTPLSAQVAQTNAGYADYEDAAVKQANAQQEGARIQTNTGLAGTAEQIKANDEAQQRIKAENDAHQKVVQAITDHPIDENDFWTTGRTISAAIALALSGFTHGASGGRDQTSGLVGKMLDDQVNRWMRSQQENRNSVLEFRRQAIGDNKAAMATLKMQAYGLIGQKLQFESQKAGQDVMPPAGALVGQQVNQQRLKSIQDLSLHYQESATKTMSKAQAPLMQIDQDLVRAGVGPDPQKARENYAKAMGAGPTDGNLGGKLTAADNLRAAGDLLKHIAANNGGTLPNQEIWGADGVEYFRKKLAQLGNADSADAVTAATALNKAIFEIRKALPSSKLADANSEVESLKSTIDTGETKTTLRNLDDAIQQADESVSNTGSRFAPGHGQDLIDIVRREQRNTRVAPAGKVQFTPIGGQSAAPTQSENVVSANAGGGPAPQSPLAQSPSAYAPGTPPEAAPNTPNQDQNPMRLQTLQTLSNEASKAGLDGGAISRIVRFESGGNAAAKNPSGATGLIQWMPEVFKGMAKPNGYENVRHEDLKDLTAEEQVPLVIQYFKEKGVKPGSDIGDYYLAVAAPSAIGKPDETVVYKKGSAAWTQNPSWRPADGGDITAGSIRAKARTF